MNKITALYLIRLIKLYLGVAMNNHFAIPGRLTVKSQSFFAIEPINQIAANGPFLAPQHDLDLAVAIADPCLSVHMYRCLSSSIGSRPLGLRWVERR